MELFDIPLKLPGEMISQLRVIARDRDESIGRVVRDIVGKDLRRRASAKTPNRADELLVARLQRLLAAEMASADSWSDIQKRLSRHGYELRPAGGGLTLHERESGRRLCKSSELGFAYSRLVRKFGAPMPGHPHLMRHLLNETAVDAQSPDDDLELIEPFEPDQPFFNTSRPSSSAI